MPGRGSMRRLWAPWRMEYIQSASGATATGRARRTSSVGERANAAARGKGEEEDCLFCRLAARRKDREDLVLVRRPHAFLMLNRFPYNPAHVMVALVRHVSRFSQLTAAERSDLLDLGALVERALAAEYRPHGINVGANLGRIAGAGYPGHLHLHFVPRWNGDTNFMPTIAETRVLPESLSRTWTRLRRAIIALDPEGGPARAGSHGRKR